MLRTFLIEENDVNDNEGKRGMILWNLMRFVNLKLLSYEIEGFDQFGNKMKEKFGNI